MPEFSSIQEVDSEFFRLFTAGASTVEKDIGKAKNLPHVVMQNYSGQDVSFLVRYFNRSGADDTEELEAVYPSITIQNFMPTVDRRRVVAVLPGYEGNYQEGEDGDVVGSIVPFAIPLDFRYQVTAVTNREKDISAFKNWFYATFDSEKPEPCFLMNQVETDNGPLGVVVPYTVEVSDVPRDDKKFEVSITFTLKPFVHVKLPGTTTYSRLRSIDIDAMAQSLIQNL